MMAGTCLVSPATEEIVVVSSLLMRGLFVGFLAGFLAFGFGKVFAEPQIDKAIAVETQIDMAKGEMPGPEIVSRHTQSTIGLLTGVVVYCSSFGGLFALVFAYANGRVGRIGPRGLAALLALAGYIAINVVPDLKYPANPPSVGHPDTIKMRTEMFFMMVLISIAAMAFAVNVCQKTYRRLGIWNAALLSGLVFIVVVAIAQSLLPDINEVPDALPAVVLWRFRIASLGTQLVLWTTLGVGFGWLTERALEKQYRFIRPALS